MTEFIREEKPHSYTVLDNTFIRDAGLSWKAKGVMTYLLSLPEGWRIYQCELEKHALDGRESLTKAMRELEARGYLEKEQKKSEAGRFDGYIYRVIECPGNHRCGFTAAEKPFTEKPFTENPQLLNTDLNKYTEDSNKESVKNHTPAKKAPFSPPSVEEVASYCTERGNGIDPQAFIDYYEARGWRFNNGAKVKDWRAVVRTWERRDAERVQVHQAENKMNENKKIF